jgi:hypothetical protein
MVSIIEGVQNLWLLAGGGSITEQFQRSQPTVKYLSKIGGKHSR